MSIKIDTYKISILLIKVIHTNMSKTSEVWNPYLEWSIARENVWGKIIELQNIPDKSLQEVSELEKAYAFRKRLENTPQGEWKG